MHIRPAEARDQTEWLRLRHALWPESGADLASETASYHVDGTLAGLASGVLVIDRDCGGALGGFAEVSLRPLASGCRTTPVGYLEGWWVAPDLRRQGWGRRLFEAAQRWAVERGCCEMASDREVANQVSHLAHVALDFRVAGSEVCFSKPIANKQRDATLDESAAVGLLPVRLNSAAAIEFVADPAAGGIAHFAGTTRAETSAEGRRLLALDYEAYPEMAQRQLRDLAARARERWPLIRLALLHRTGRVTVGEASVLIAVSTPHRAEAFECCRWLIDTLKAELAVWKKEVWEGGEATWARPNAEWKGGK